MVLRSLLVSVDDGDAAVLTSVLSEFAIATQLCAYPEGPFRLPEHIDALIVDLADPVKGTSVIQTARGAQSPPLIVAVLPGPVSLRDALAAGANFALYSPISEGTARSTLQAAIALIKRERRRCFRVPVQVPVQLQLQDGTEKNVEEKEGILLDISEDGIDVLTAEPICPSTKLRARFILPASQESVEVCGEVAWANPNGQSGVRFVEISASLHNTFSDFVAGHAPEPPDEDPWHDSGCRLTDLSLGACYVDTASPFPERSVVQLRLNANQIEVTAEGTVRVMHPGAGMGIEFASRTAAQREEVQSLLNLLTSCPGTLPQLQIAPRALFATDEFLNESRIAFDDPLLQLLRNHESLSHNEFLRELQRQRSSQEEVTA